MSLAFPSFQPHILLLEIVMENQSLELGAGSRLRQHQVAWQPCSCTLLYTDLGSSRMGPRFSQGCQLKGTPEKLCWAPRLAWVRRSSTLTPVL